MQSPSSPADPKIDPPKTNESNLKRAFNYHLNTWVAILMVLIFAGTMAAIFFFIDLDLKVKANASAEASQIAKSKNNEDPEVAKIKKAMNNKGKWMPGRNEGVSDLPLEGKKKLLGLLKEKGQVPAPTASSGSTVSSQILEAMPGTLDWRNNGGNFISPVKNQSSCGSCWAFASAAALESATQIAKRSTSSLDSSEQTLVSCSGAGNCSGGYISSAASYIKSYGLPPEKYFPYTAQNTVCTSTKDTWQNVVSKISSYTSIASNLADMKAAIYTTGPLVTTFAVYSDFYYYKSGVYQYATGTLVGYHAVLIVGYDDASQSFVAKNSWGSGWGESGYFRIGYSELSTRVQFGGSNLSYKASTSTPSAISTVKVTSPNGSEQWEQGTQNKITWTYAGDPGNLIIVLLDGLGSTSTTIASGIAASSGSFTWTVPSTQNIGTEYKVKISSIASSTINDQSDNFFSIIAPLPAGITVTVPNGGERYRANNTVSLKWNYTGTSITKVNIDLLSGNSIKPIAANNPIGTNGSGTYKWKVPKTKGTNFQIRISSAANPSVLDISDGYFTIY